MVGGLALHRVMSLTSSGIGPEIAEAVKTIFKAAKVGLGVHPEYRGAIAG
jgi:isocitrate/isopropylmalate dehydrogenase